MKKGFTQLIIVLVCVLCITQSGETSDYWPTDRWRTSTPAAQGVNPNVLADMLSKIRSIPNSIDSVLIVKNGYLVLDAYFYPFQKEWPHIIHSCTKSITSTLIGIAIDRGAISGVDLGLLDFFPDISPTDMADTKKNITLEHVLTMSAGLACTDSYKYRWTGLKKLRQSPDWTRHMLDLPMREAPGSQFDYCNGATYLLSAILQKQTGMRSLDFARKHLFDPLGITDVTWEKNSQGIDIGYGRMWLKPHDMAKFGWLFLKRGKWDNKTIVSEAWVSQATKGHIKATLFDQYGYQWWVDKGFYAAVGYGGQRIFVVPEQNMVVVFTSQKKFGKPDKLMKEYVLKSVARTSKILDLNANARLKRLVKKCQRSPKALPVPELPPISKKISGEKYIIDSNRAGFKHVTIRFGDKKNVAEMSYGLNNKEYKVGVGLDGVWRISPSPADGGRIACKGEWVNPESFSFSYINVGHTKGAKIFIKFKDRRAFISMPGPGGMFLTMIGRQE